MPHPAPALNAIFADPETLHAAFAAGIEAMLAQGTLGAFVLGCANAGNQWSLQRALGGALVAEFARLQDGLRAGRLAVANAEDLAVFERLAAWGPERLPPTARRAAGPWRLQYNALRALRPQRHAATVPATLRQAFNPEGFHFNKPFMDRERLWEGRWRGHALAAYYNKFPFADYHLLWVPHRGEGLPQYLTAETHALMIELTRELGAGLPGFAMSFNALGAMASVNHLHFQSYVGEPLPITASHWRHHGGARDYPLSCEVDDRADSSWRFIESLHAANQPYHLLYTPRHVYCIPRKRQGSYAQPSWSAGLAWCEACGDLVTTTEQDYAALTAEALTATLAGLRPGAP